MPKQQKPKFNPLKDGKAQKAERRNSVYVGGNRYKLENGREVQKVMDALGHHYRERYAEALQESQNLGHPSARKERDLTDRQVAASYDMTEEELNHILDIECRARIANNAPEIEAIYTPGSVRDLTEDTPTINSEALERPKLGLKKKREEPEPEKEFSFEFEEEPGR